MNNSSNSSSLPLMTYSSEKQTRDWILLILYLITAIVAMVGNTFVCLVINKKPNMRSTTYILVFNMAISDIIGGFTILGQWFTCASLFLESEQFGPFFQRLCGLLKSMQILSYYASTYTMTAIAIERYRLICYPLSASVRASIHVITIWILGIIFTSTTFFSMRVSEYFSPTQGLITCRVIFASKVSLTLRKARVLLVMVTQYIIPLIIIGYLYGMVIHRVWQRKSIGSVSEHKKQEQTENKRKTIKMLIIVVVMFAIAWFPTHLIHFFKFYTNIIPVTKGKCNASTFYLLCYWLAISSCSYNPFIYCYFNDDFKIQAFKCWNFIFPKLKINFSSDQNNKETGSNETNPTSQTDNVTTRV